MGDTWGDFCTGSALFLFNGVDLICGTVLIVYSSYLGVNGFAPEWLYAPIVVVGSILVLTAFMSWCGASNHSCSCLLTLSAGLLILMAVAELVMAIIIFTQGPAINKFLHDHQQELKLTDDELKRFEAHKFVPAYLLLALFCMEVLRFCCSSHLNRSRQYRRYHYRNLHAIRDLDEDLGNLRKEQEISTRYANLKDKYKKKYQTPLMMDNTSTDNPINSPWNAHTNDTNTSTSTLYV